MERLFTCMVLLYWFPVASQALSWGDLQQEIERLAAGKPATQLIHLRLFEVFETVAIYTKALKAHKPNSALFCSANDTQMHFNQLVSMIRHQARQEQATAQEPVQALLLRALQQQFPCKSE